MYFFSLTYGRKPIYQQANNISNIFLIPLASNRVFGLLNVFLKNGWKINFVCCSKQSKKEAEELNRYLNVNSQFVDPADYNATQKFFKNSPHKPDVAIFDTFIAEEKYSHYLHRSFPNCLRVLDLQDIHSLRLKRGEHIQQGNLEKFDGMLDVLKLIPNPNEDVVFGRELASIYRSDLTLTCSDYEEYILKKHFKIENTALITFFYSDLKKKDENYEDKYDFDFRKHFVWIGNFGHPPNLNALDNCIKYIWPGIKEKIPNAELHIYGANFRKEYSKLHEKDPSIKSKGLMKSIEHMTYYRALLAPLHFGAGIKGKITDAWFNYLPVITTPIGAEGMFLNTYNNSKDYRGIKLNSRFYNDENEGETPKEDDIDYNLTAYYEYKSKVDPSQMQNLEFGGSFLNYNVEDFVTNSVEIYKNKDKWKYHVDTGRKILEKRMAFKVNEIMLMKKITDYQLRLSALRKSNFLQSMTWSETLRSTENFAKYINEKNKSKKEQKN